MTGITLAGQQTAQAIKDQATELFFLHGFEATSLRQVADQVGIRVGSLYNHISGKEELLQQIMGGTMDELMELQAKALNESDGILEKIVSLLHVHIRFHAEHAKVVFIGNSELRSLSPENRTAIIQKRKTYQLLIESLLIEAGNQGKAQILDSRLHAFSIVAMGTHVASWYKPSGGQSLESIATTYAKIALRGLGVKNADSLVDNQIPVKTK